MSEELPVVHRSDLESSTSDAGRSEESVVGVVLAAGTGSRFGARNKLLATVNDGPIVRRATRTLVGADVDFDSVVVVVGFESDRVADALGDLDVEIVENPDYADGRATSIEAGLDTVAGAGAALFALGDQPLVRPDTVETLVRAYRAGAGTALASAHEERRGNPVLFDSALFDELLALEGEAGGREVLVDHEDAALVDTGDPGVLQDVDTPEDLEALEDRKDPG